MFLSQDEVKKIKDLSFRLDQRAGDMENDFSNMAVIEVTSNTDTTKGEKAKKLDPSLGKTRKRFFSKDSKTFSATLKMKMEDVIEEEIVFSYRYYLEFLFYHVLFYIFLGNFLIFL